jgi:hypothetical protein
MQIFGYIFLVEFRKISYNDTSMVFQPCFGGRYFQKKRHSRKRFGRSVDAIVSVGRRISCAVKVFSVFELHIF